MAQQTVYDKAAPLDGSAKPSPTEPEVGEIRSEFTLTTPPFMSKAGLPNCRD